MNVHNRVTMVPSIDKQTRATTLYRNAMNVHNRVTMVPSIGQGLLALYTSNRVYVCDIVFRVLAINVSPICISVPKAYFINQHNKFEGFA